MDELMLLRRVRAEVDQPSDEALAEGRVAKTWDAAALAGEGRSPRDFEASLMAALRPDALPRSRALITKN